MKTYIFFKNKNTGAVGFYGIKDKRKGLYDALERYNGAEEWWADAIYFDKENIKTLQNDWFIIFGRAKSLENFKKRHKVEIMIELL